MKRFFLFNFIISCCFATSFQITKVIPACHIYILENKYVLQANSELKGYKKGDFLDVDIECFFNSECFQQDVLISKGKYVTRKETDIVIGDHLLDVRTEDHYITRYEDKSYYKRVQFTPLGTLKQSSISLKDFCLFASCREMIQPLKSYMYMYEDVNWFYTNKDFDYQNDFPKAGSGEELSLGWLAEGYQLIDSGFKEEIYLVHNKNFPEYLSAVIYTGKKRKFFLSDRITSIAKFQ